MKKKPPPHILDLVAEEREQRSQAIRATLPTLQHAEGRAIACGDSCAWCCHIKLITDLLDGMVAFRWLLKQGRWTSGLRLALLKADAELCRFTHAECLKMLLPCVFLDHGASQASTTGKCSIYPARPLACGVTFAYLPGQELCGRVGGKASFQAVPNTPDQYELSRRAIKQYGLKPEYMSFPGAVLTAEADHLGRSRPDIARVTLVGDGLSTRHVDELFDQNVLALRDTIEEP